MLAQVDLETLVSRCRSVNGRTYIKEAVDCYRIGAYRACVITTWIALVYDFIDKLRELAFTGDAAASKRVLEFDEIQKKRDTDAALSFERDVLRIAKDDFELISAQEYADLQRLFDDRNRCGHPNLNRESDIYTPPPELARLHLRVVIEHVLERPPVQGKAAVSLLQQTVDSDYFPTNVDEAERVLRATPLTRAKRNLVREFVLGGVISLMREPIVEKKMWQRFAAVRVTHRFHPDIVESLLREKFDDAVFKSPDNCFYRILWLLVVCPDYQPLIVDATWTKLENYVRDIPATEVDAVLLALQLSRLHQSAIGRLQKSERFELSGIISRLRVAPPRAFIDQCIATFAGAGSWDAANSMAASLIDPLVKYIDTQQGLAIIGAGANYEVRGSFAFPGVAWSVKNTGLLTKEQLAGVIATNNLTARLGHLIDQPSNP